MDRPQSCSGHHHVNMLSLLLLPLLATLSVNGDQTIQWTITGEPFQACIRPGEVRTWSGRSYHYVLGEKLTFEWAGGHNVERVSQEGYEECSGFKSDKAVAGPFDFKTSTSGTYYFVCGVGGHCEFGKQKAIVTVDRSCWVLMLSFTNIYVKTTQIYLVT